MTGLVALARKVVPPLLLHVVRPLGKVLPPPALGRLAWPVAASLALLQLIRLGPTLAEFDGIPAALRPSRRRLGWLLALWRDRTRMNLAWFFGFWPDLLPDRRWGQLCRLEGPRPTLEAIESGTRPVILATLHFGPQPLMYYWFRSRGVPVAYLTSTPEAEVPPYRLRLHQLCDRAGGLEGVPRRFQPGQLRDVAEFLQPGRVLFVSVTGGIGRTLAVGDEQVDLLIGPGTFQLAAIVDAIVIPCLARAGPLGVVTILLGDPVPQADLHDRRRHRAACEHLFRFALPTLHAYPGQFDTWLIERLRPHGDPGGRPAGDEGRREGEALGVCEGGPSAL